MYVLTFLSTFLGEMYSLRTSVKNVLNYETDGVLFRVCLLIFKFRMDQMILVLGGERGVIASEWVWITVAPKGSPCSSKSLTATRPRAARALVVEWVWHRGRRLC